MPLPYIFRRAVDPLLALAVIVLGALFGVYTSLHVLLVERKPSLAFNLRHWSDANSARLLRYLGPISYKEGLPVVPSIVEQANRVVVDVGPGTGQNLRHFDREKITKLYLIEPNVGMHAELEANLRKGGLSDIATVISCGVQDTMTLSSHGLSPCTADSVVTVNVLCCVPSQESACKSLYSLLKPGGQWLVYEHVVAEPKYPIPRLLQHAYNIVWPFFLGGCNIKRDTAEVLKRAGTWETVDLDRKNGEGGWEMLGHIVGKLVKPM
ncbi:hypothetical protein NCS52_01564000 [Fusarium sp. LHS14.1]|nr:hypothetical protein NCS52_01564000 [Fusarium sp. LHS14.1]